jgi:hypothetical protein
MDRGTAKVADFAKIAKLQTTSCIPDVVYQSIPKWLTKGCAHISDPRERDTFFLGSMAVLSGCFPSIQGLYGGRLFNPNLYLFVIAPPASGKGILSFARDCGHKLDRSLVDEFKWHLPSDKDALRNAKIQAFYLPADSSAAVLKKALNDTDGVGVIFQTEADTLTSTLSKEWGSYSDILRMAFQHEVVSSMRFTDASFVSIESPKLSVVLSGTYDQFRKLIPSTENGLFSRFMFYFFDQKPVWKNQFEDRYKHLAESVGWMQGELFKMHHCFKEISLRFELNSNQQALQTKFFSELLSSNWIFRPY